jgi:hypothetical protein
MDGLDAPQPLSPELRQRLLSQLLDPTTSLPLDQALAARLTDELTDPVADLMHDLDAARPLPAALRGQLAVGVRRSRPRWLPAVSAAAAAVVALALALVLPGRDQPSPLAGRDPEVSLPPPSASATPTPDGLTGGVGGIGVPLSPVPTPTPRPRPPRSATPASVTAAPDPAPTTREPSIGYYSYSSSGSSLPRTDGTAGPSPTPTPTPTPAPPPNPNVSSRSPGAGPLAGGTTVHFYGSHLDGAFAVRFGTKTGTDLRRVSSRHLVVVSPPQARGTVTVSILFRERSGQFVIPKGFTYVATPQLDSVSPGSGSTNGGEWLELTGTDLRHVTAVLFDGAAAQEVQVVSDTTVRVQAPRHDVGTAEITVTSPGGTSNAVDYLYVV